jgi:hypothetical protein
MADSKRARSWKRRTLPRIDLTNAEPVLYSTYDFRLLMILAICVAIPQLWRYRSEKSL